MREIEKVAVEVFSCVSHDSEVLADYDRSEDVIYVNFLNSSPQKADFGTKLGDYIVRFKKNKIVGVTILNAMEHSRKRFNDMPDVLCEMVVLV